MLLLDTERVTDLFAEIVGEENILLEKRGVASYEKNVSGLNVAVGGVLLPGSKEEVKHVVKVAAEHNIGLYPISKGLNWGLGSRLPVRDNCFILDMRRMNRIIAVDEEQQYVILEPGVTQEQLYEYLTSRNLPLTFNVTGSGVEASVLGNALDRGVGYRSARAEDVLGLEVVAGTGECISTGYGHYEKASTSGLYPYGIGPDMNGLFLQSALGIVTAATLRLFPVKEKQMAVLCTLQNPESLEIFLDSIAWLRKQEVLTSVVHVGNKARTKVTVMPLLEEVLGEGTEIDDDKLREEAEKLYDSEMTSAWTALATLDGTSEQVNAAVKAIKKSMAAFGRITVVDKEMIAKRQKMVDRLSFIPSIKRRGYLLKALKPLLGLPLGIPSDVAIKGVYWAVGEKQPKEGMNPDDSRAGLKFILPTAPLSGYHGEAVASLTEEVFSAYGFTPYITLNTITSRSFGCVINLSFDREDSGESERAQQCADELLKRLINKGYYPYRVNVGQMNMVVNKDDSFWQVADSLKKALDPAGILSPGKYSLS